MSEVGGCGLDLLIIRPWLLDHLRLDGAGLDDHRGCGLRLCGRRHDVRDLDGPRLKLVGEFLVQKVTNHKNGDNCHDVENIERGLGGDVLDDGTLGMIDDWSAHY